LFLLVFTYNIYQKTLKKYFLGQETATPKANILQKHLKPRRSLLPRGEPLQNFNTQSSATGAPGKKRCGFLFGAQCCNFRAMKI